MIKSILKLILGIILIVFVAVVGPLVGIWSLNTLFASMGLNIEYTWQTWLASFWLTSILGSSIIKTKAK